jgi:hypothetical protein
MNFFLINKIQKYLLLSFAIFSLLLFNGISGVSSVDQPFEIEFSDSDRITDYDIDDDSKMSALNAFSSFQKRYYYSHSTDKNIFRKLGVTFIHPFYRGPPVKL